MQQKLFKHFVNLLNTDAPKAILDEMDLKNLTEDELAWIRHQRLEAFLASKMRSIGMSTNIDAILGRTGLSQKHYVERLAFASELCAACEENGVLISMVKGLVMAHLAYRDVYARRSGDDDFLIEEDGIPFIHKWLVEKGYEQKVFESPEGFTGAGNAVRLDTEMYDATELITYERHVSVPKNFPIEICFRLPFCRKETAFACLVEANDLIIHKHKVRGHSPIFALLAISCEIVADSIGLYRQAKNRFHLTEYFDLFNLLTNFPNVLQSFTQSGRSDIEKAVVLTAIRDLKCLRGDKFVDEAELLFGAVDCSRFARPHNWLLENVLFMDEDLRTREVFRKKSAQIYERVPLKTVPLIQAGDIFAKTTNHVEVPNTLFLKSLICPVIFEGKIFLSVLLDRKFFSIHRHKIRLFLVIEPPVYPWPFGPDANYPHGHKRPHLFAVDVKEDTISIVRCVNGAETKIEPCVITSQTPDLKAIDFDLGLIATILQFPQDKIAISAVLQRLTAKEGAEGRIKRKSIGRVKHLLWNLHSERQGKDRL